MLVWVVVGIVALVGLAGLASWRRRGRSGSDLLSEPCGRNDERLPRQRSHGRI